MSILDRLGRIQRYVHTITFDRGSEFVEDRLLEEHLKRVIRSLHQSI